LGISLPDKKFQCVGDGLQQAVRADAHWAEARLHVGQDLALDEDNVSRR